MLRHVTLLGRGAAMVRDDDLSLLKKFVSDAYAFAEQPAGIAAEIEHHALKVAEFVQRLDHFGLGGLIKAGYVHMANARPTEELYCNAVPRNLIGCEGERKGFFDTRT